MSKTAEKIVQYLFKALGEKNFVEFVKLLVAENIMSQGDFNNLKRVFEKKQKKKKSSSDFRKFLKQQRKAKTKSGAMNTEKIEVKMCQYPSKSGFGNVDPNSSNSNNKFGFN